MQILTQTYWLDRIRGYGKISLIQDLIAALIVTVLLIPQSLAYAMLAGLRVEVGLYASILPLMVYAIFGSSKTLSVGPVAVLSLMTASTLGNVTQSGDVSLITAATTLALLSGIILLVMGLLKLGALSHFLSHSVISGFISASGIIIALSQLKHIFGVDSHGDTLLELIPALVSNINQFHLITLFFGITVIVFLMLAKNSLGLALKKLGLKKDSAELIAKTAPIIGVIGSIAVASMFQMDKQGLSITGDIPSGLPTLGLTIPSAELLKMLFLPALLISIIGYVESISVGKTLANKRRQTIDANKELVGLGAANVAASLSGGFPVTGGFSRTVVNFDAGATTQMASVFAAIGIALASLFLTPFLYYLPKATLAATIIVAVISLIDFSMFRKTWRFDRSDFYALTTTLLLTLFFGVEIGVASGVILSIVLYLRKTSAPHIAEVGQIEGSEHFRNIHRYETQTLPELLSLRPDERLFFANINQLEDLIQTETSTRKEISHIVLMCSAVNDIDFSALEALETLNDQLEEIDIQFHFSEIKGPVMDKLKQSGLLAKLSGKTFLSQYEAFNYIKQLRSETPC